MVAALDRLRIGGDALKTSLRPLDHDLRLGRMVSQDRRQGKSVGMLVRRHNQERVRVATEHGSTRYTVDSIASREIALGKVGGNEDGRVGVLREFSSSLRTCAISVFEFSSRSP